jgi:hypothetical protein
MKITLTPPGGAQAFVLADDSVSRVVATVSPSIGAGGSLAEGFVPVQERAVQVTPLARSPYVFIAPRFNLKNGLTLTVSRTFATVEMCVNFLAAHSAAAPASGLLELQSVTASGTILRFLPNAVLQSVKCLSHTGVTCRFQYILIASNPWQTIP